MTIYVCKNPACRKFFNGATLARCPFCGTPKDEAWNRGSRILNRVQAKEQNRRVARAIR